MPSGFSVTGRSNVTDSIIDPFDLHRVRARPRLRGSPGLLNTLVAQERTQLAFDPGKFPLSAHHRIDILVSRWRFVAEQCCMSVVEPHAVHFSLQSPDIDLLRRFTTAKLTTRTMRART